MAEVQTKPIGVIDALSAGYRLLNRAWEAWLVPLVLDVFFWLGPQVSPWRAIRAMLDQVPPEMREQVLAALGMDTWAEMPVTQGPNLLTLISIGPGAASPLAATFGALPAPPGWSRPFIAPAAPWGMMGLFVGLLMLGAPLAGFYLTLVTRAVARGQGMPVPDFWPRWAWTSGHLFLLVLMALVVLFGFSMGFGFLLALGLVVGGVWVSALLVLGSLAFTWVLIGALVFFYFTPVSIAWERATAWQALARSAYVVLRYPGASLGLMVVTFIIAEGFGLIWARLLGSLPGLLVSMVGNAYLTAGLTVAAFLFYQSRWQALQSWRAERHAPLRQ